MSKDGELCIKLLTAFSIVLAILYVITGYKYPASMLVSIYGLLSAILIRADMIYKELKKS